MELIPFADQKPHSFNELLCDGVAARNLGSFAALLALHAQLQAEHPEMRVLASLDDRGQAEYTSAHTSETNDLDNVEGHDLSALTPEAFENGVHRGYLSTPAEFPIRLANLRARAVPVEEVRGCLAWATDGDRNDPLVVNRDPDAKLRIDMEKEVLFQFVPVAAAADALAAFPNAYFTSDLDPFETHALARHMEAEYGLALFGVGAAYLGFRRADPFDAATAQRLAEDIGTFYAHAQGHAVAALAALLTGRDWLLLRYTES
ncbi:hypothetical protein [Sphingomonas sp. KR3-1]|uniref:hypothetical protein n=1 Tax=Sphingomonas sp. KR3-1 TaxID=3156611 RepID=UPI0032B539D7